MNHTPTPWRTAKGFTGEDWERPGALIVQGHDYAIADCNVSSAYRPESNDNAAFIVTACNNHDSLVAENARLREALKGIIAALTQNKTYPADINYAITMARSALGEGER